MREVLIGACFTLLGTILTLGVQWWTGYLERRDKFRLAAIDRRLEAHQKAFSLWQKLMFSLRNEADRHAVVDECQAFWQDKCLYLATEVRRDFHAAYMVADLVVSEDMHARKEVGTQILNLGKVIERAVGLPPIRKGEVAKE